MKIDLYRLPFYYQTTLSSKVRQQHIEAEFSDLYSVPVYSPTINAKIKSQQIAKFCAGAQAHMRVIDMVLRSNKMNENSIKYAFQPFVLLEDDVSKYRKFPKYITVPDDTDLLYIGLSKCSVVGDSHCIGNFGFKTEYPGLVKIHRMLSNHGILYCSLRACTMMSNALSECIYQKYVWDIIPAKVQRELNAYALEEPLVYQDMRFGGQEEVTKFSLDGENLLDIKDIHATDAVSNYCNSDVIV